MTVLVATTVASYKADQSGLTSWLSNAEDMLDDRDGAVTFFCAAQIGQGHDGRLDPLRRVLEGLGGVWWPFSVDMGESSIDGRTRLCGITTGRNLALEYVNVHQDVEAVLFVDSDMVPPPDAVSRLLEVDRPLVGGTCPTYCLDGLPVVRRADLTPRQIECPLPAWLRTRPPGEPVDDDETEWQDHNRAWVRAAEDDQIPVNARVSEHWTTAGALLVRREAARKLRWRWDLDAGMTDDPAFQHDAVTFGFGMTWTRHDVEFLHVPESIVPVEHRGHDLSVVR